MKSFPAILFPVFFLFFSLQPVLAQEGDIRVSENFDGLNTFEFFNRMEDTYSVRIFYIEREIPDIPFRISADSSLLGQVIRKNLSEYNIQVSRYKKDYFLLKDKKIATRLSADFFDQQEIDNRAEQAVEPAPGGEQDFMKTYDDYIDETIVIGTNHQKQAKGQYLLRGKVVNDEDHQPVPNATLLIEELNKHTTSDVNGEYSLRLKSGSYTLSVNNLTSYEKKFKITVLSGGRLDVELKTKTFMLGEAVVTAGRHDNVQRTTMGIEKVDPVDIKKMPVVMGEQDIVKVALMLPGVQSVGELSSGFNVRGSPADQNVFYINNIPVYNVSHLYGLYTSFNPDAIGDFSLYKGDIPIEYGGRLSSLFDIETKRGNQEELSARGGIGPISSNLMIEGPISKGKSSYLVSGRTTYLNWMLEQIKNLDIRNSSAAFSDALVNLYVNPDSLNSFSFLASGSQDKSDLAFGINNQYTNAGVGFEWTHHFCKNLRSEFNLVHSMYGFDEERTNIPYRSSKHSFELNHSELKYKLIHEIHPDHTLNYGVNSLFYKLHPGDLVPFGEKSNISPIDFNPEQAWKNSFFIGDEWKVTHDLVLKGGMRATLYSYLGPNKILEYREGYPREEDYIQDSTSYNRFQPIENYPRVDYRLSGRYSFSNDLSVKASYSTLHQYMFLLSNTISVSPTDKWKLADPHIKPMKGQQLSAGIYKNFGDHLETSLEGYYKKVDHIVEYKDGAEFLTNKNPETAVIQGDLDAYGVELMVRKKSGRWNGWINYTYSNSTVQALSPQRGEYVNRGLSYPANYDKPHAVNMTVNYDLTRRINISANAVYATGRPVTYPTSVYYQDNMELVNFSRRNQYRMSDYFRIDLALNIEGNLKKDKLAHGSWSLSFYNLTSRENPYFIYFKNEEGTIKGYSLSILGTIIPSVKYNLKLGNYED